MVMGMEMPANMEILHRNDIWVCDAAASNHVAKSKDGSYNYCKTDIVSQGMIGGHVEVSMLMDFTVTNYTKAGMEGATFKMTGQFQCNLFSVQMPSRGMDYDW